MVRAVWLRFSGRAGAWAGFGDRGVLAAVRVGVDVGWLIRGAQNYLATARGPRL
ncbi:hypothetical protein [Streptomyces sp. NPDC058622]|uniref:hypothetical protein n=1 Tax=Streptomyces sp. NPDC058622 TaxID=3346562 RepID=UPI003659151B